MFVASWQTPAVVGINDMLSTCGHFTNGFMTILQNYFNSSWGVDPIDCRHSIYSRDITTRGLTSGGERWFIPFQLTGLQITRDCPMA
jgi:hypothetical protein